MILLDTSVLSAAFRRRHAGRAPVPPEVAALRRILAAETPVMMPGVVLQEVLSGIRRDARKVELRDNLEGIPVLLAARQDHEAAADIMTKCAAGGVAATAVDCLIAAQCIAVHAELLTLDLDFSRIATRCDLRLHRL